MFEKKVLLLEKHYVVGGLNSFYAKGSKKFDVGLHALTNYPSGYSGKEVSPAQIMQAVDEFPLIR